MIHYILQIIGFQLLFLVVYDAFLKKETFFTWNRIYLLATPLLSFLLPLVKIPSLQQSIPDTYRIVLPEVLLGPVTQDVVMQGGVLQEVVIVGTQSISLLSVLLNVWYIGILMTTLLLAFKLYKIYKLSKLGEHSMINNLRVIAIPDSDVAFSFFNTMFLGTKLSEKQRASILLHETIHIKERHSLDMLFFEIQRIVFWFNPLVYVYQNKMMLLQEYTADAKVIAQTDKKTYYQNLLSQVFQTESISFTNTFFNHSLIKKRIIMLQKSKSSELARAKYLFLLPVVSVMLFYTACTDEGVQSDTGNLTLEDKIVSLMVEVEEEDEISAAQIEQIKSLLRKANSKSATGRISEKTFYERESKYIHYDDADAIPFAVIEQVPTYPGCTGENEVLKKCMSDKISQHVGREFDTSIGKTLGLSGVNRIFVSFKIDQEGNVVNVRSRAPHPDLELEAGRVMNTLPQMKPGQQKGKPVSVLYSLPITFKIQD